jgi:rhomboid family protein
MIPLKDDNPTIRKPYVTVAFIILNCIAFLYEYSLGRSGFSEFTFKYGLIPMELMHGKDLMAPELSHLSTSPYLNIFSSMFMHGGLLHLGGNMLYLWIFGNNIEDVLGHVKFVFFYLLSGIAAVLAFTFLNPNSTVPMVGASGAVSGILGAYLIRFPQAKVLTLIWFLYFIKIVRLPAVYLLGFWFLLQIINGSRAISYSSSGGVAWFAHIGGFLFGVVVFIMFGKLTKKRPRHV